jgi:excisionase family DNA binding protein
MERDHKYLKVPEVAEVLRIARSQAYELVANGTIPAVKIGRSVRVSRMGLERWLEERALPKRRAAVTQACEGQKDEPELD